MISFLYWDITGSVPFDLAISVISFFALNGYIVKTVRSMLLGRKW